MIKLQKQIFLSRANQPGASLGKDRSAKSGKEKGNYCRDERKEQCKESGGGSLNDNQPRAEQNAPKHPGF